MEIEEDNIFDPELLPSSITLDLNVLYDRAVGTELVRCFQEQAGIHIQTMTWNGNNVNYEQFQPENLPGWNRKENKKDDDDEDDEDDEDDSNDDDEQENILENVLFRVNGSPYVLPDDGILSVDLQCTPGKRNINNHISKKGLHGLLSLVFGQEDSSSPRDIFIRLETSMCDAFITAKQAKIILNRFTDPTEKRKVLPLLLTRLADATTKFQVIEENVTNPKDIELIEQKMGAMFYFTANNPSGHYSLNLDNAFDRKVAQALFHQNNDDSRWSEEKSGRNDVSQHGNWSSIRKLSFFKSANYMYVWSSKYPLFRIEID